MGPTSCPLLYPRQVRLLLPDCAQRPVSKDPQTKGLHNGHVVCLMQHPTSPTAGRQQQKKDAAKKKEKKSGSLKGAWVGGMDKTVDGDKFYNKAKVGMCGRVRFQAGSGIALHSSAVRNKRPPSGQAGLQVLARANSMTLALLACLRQAAHKSEI